MHRGFCACSFVPCADITGQVEIRSGTGGNSGAPTRPPRTVYQTDGFDSQGLELGIVTTVEISDESAEEERGNSFGHHIRDSSTRTMNIDNVASF